MKPQLRISQDLALPLDAQTQTLVVYGGKGTGKSHLGRVVVEELARQSLRFCVIDPLDVWYGVQHGATKGKPGIEVVILGGPHGDLPIEPASGAVVADFVVDESVSTLVVLRRANGEMWTVGERIRFVTEFCQRLYARQGEKRVPLMLAIDEAGRFCPQNPGRGDFEIAKCIGAIEQLVEWGRNVGVGVMLITQRSARMNKSVSELAECMIAFRTVGPNSIAAIVDWFGEHVPRERQRELVEQLRTLPRGTALVVSPGWLGFEGTVRIRASETFDSSATPEPGKTLRAPGAPAKPDLDKYRERLAATIERAEQEDPKALRRRVAELERDLSKRTQQPAEPERVEVPVVPAELLGKLADAQAFLRDTISNADCAKVALDLASLAAQVPPRRPAKGESIRSGQLPASERAEAPTKAVNGSSDLGRGGLRRMLIALAQSMPNGLTRRGLALRAGMSFSSGTFSNYLGQGRGAGWLTERGDRFVITDAGSVALGDYQQLPTGAALLEHWIQAVGSDSGKARILRVLGQFYPHAVRRELLAEQSGMNAGSGTFSNYVGALRTLELIEGRSEFRLRDELMGQS